LLLARKMAENGGGFNCVKQGARGMAADVRQLLAKAAGRPILIAGPTASGKSALALALAEADGRPVVNADALQVWSCWRLLSARPDAAEEARAPHFLFGHRAPGEDYSVGHWLREVDAVLAAHPAPILVGGTGLYLTALTEGLTDIPPIPPATRAKGDTLRPTPEGVARMIAALDPETRSRIDLKNPMRVQRAWEVAEATGRGLADWQAATGPARLAGDAALKLRIEADRDWLAERIDRRFDAMIAHGALDEVAAVRPYWDAQAPWARAIGAAELMAHLEGSLPLAEAITRAQALSRQYAKRQRTWLRARMAGWQPVARP